MEIRSNIQPTPVRSASESAPCAGVRPSGGSSGGFQVSQSARELGDLARLVHASSGIRQDKVDAIKRQVDSGSYQVNLDKLADRLSSEI